MAVPTSCHIVIIIIILCVLLPAVSGRSVPTSPLSDEKAEELVLESLERSPLIEEKLSPAKLLTSKVISSSEEKPSSNVRRVVRMEAITRKELISRRQALKKAEDQASSSRRVNEALFDEEARQVPGGPDPLHHSNQPTSP